MKNKLKFLVNVSLKRKIKTKWFLIANICLAIVLVGLFNIDHIVNYFGGDFKNINKIYLIDNANTYELFSKCIEENYKIIDTKYEIIKINSKDEVLEKLKDKKESNSVILTINLDEKNIINTELISNNFIDPIKMNSIKSALNSVKSILAINKIGMTQEQFELLHSEVNINRIILNEDQKSEEENSNMILKTVFPMFILPFFMLVLILVQMIGAEVNDEKTTKGMEIIISNVSPQIHFFSKCIAGNLFVIIQSVLLFGYTIIGFLSRMCFSDTHGISGVMNQANKFIFDLFTPGFINSLKYMIPLILILMLVTFIGYSLLAAILASMTTNTEDFQQLQTPIIIISLVGYYLSMIAGAFKGSVIINILGYFPFISAILSPSLLVIGEFNAFDVIVSIIIMIGFIFLLLKYGMKIYKAGILNYSSTNLWKKMFKAIKE